MSSFALLTNTTRGKKWTADEIGKLKGLLAEATLDAYVISEGLGPGRSCKEIHRQIARMRRSANGAEIDRLIFRGADAYKIKDEKGISAQKAKEYNVAVDASLLGT